MTPTIAAALCKVAGHPGLKALARTVKDSGRVSALLFWRCPRCGVEIVSLDVDQPQHRHAGRHGSA